MSYSINQVTLLGRVDNIIEKVYNGAFCLKFSIETQRMVYSVNDETEKLMRDWHYITLWRDRATMAKKYLRKGDYVYVVGELTYTKDKTDEKKIWTTVNVSEKTGKLLFLGPGLQESDFNVDIRQQTSIVPPIAEKKTNNILDKKPYASNAKSNVAKNPAKDLLAEDDIPF